jgi:uncharacterized membrane protein YgaE (UPF0421/DUF939 family)
MISYRNLIIYILKCVIGCIIVFSLSEISGYTDISWCIISVMLVLTPDNNEALPLAVTRIKANLIGGAVSTLCLVIAPTNAISISAAIVITIICCYFLKLMSGSRAAIAAVIIIMMHGLQFSEPEFWKTTLERVVAVIAGCAIGLLVTLLFHQRIFLKKEGTRSEEG